MSSTVQGSTYHPMSQNGSLSQAPIVAQSQITPSSQQASSSIANDTVTSPLSPRLQFSAPPMRYVI